VTVSERFDAVYAAEAPDVPRHYLQALAERESATDPAARSGSFRGLLQIGPKVAADAGVTDLVDLHDPSTNVAAWAHAHGVHRRVLERDGGDTAPRPWQREFGAVMTAMHNSGVGAVSRAMKALVLRGAPITHANIFAAGRALPSAKDRRLFRAAKERWQQSVVDLWKRLEAGAPDVTPARESELAPREVPRDTSEQPGGGWWVLLLAWLFGRGRR